jgi:LemA protein
VRFYGQARPRVIRPKAVHNSRCRYNNDSIAEVLMSALRVLMAFVLASVLSGCGYNTIQQRDEAVKSAWAEVLSQYQRRADLIPNIVASVKGETEFEQTTLQNVIEARARATSIQATPELINDPEAFARFTQAQGQVTSALSRLLLTVENYPNLKANQAFQDLRAQLEGTENRIAIARNRYIKSVEDYNVFIRQLPQSLTAMVFGYKQRPQFAVENEAAISKPPTVDFGTKK